MSEIVKAAFAGASIPAALFGFFIWNIQRKIAKREEEREEKEEARKKHELLLIQGVGASLALGEATAKAVQRIPDAHCNGDMHAALEYATKVKHEQKEFLQKQGVTALFE